MVPKEVTERNKEIMDIVASYRRSRGRTQRDCALLLNKDESTYNMLDNGTYFVLAAELDLLIDYLEIPRYELWPPSNDTPWAFIRSIARSTNSRWHITLEVDSGRLQPVEVDPGLLPNNPTNPDTNT